MSLSPQERTLRARLAAHSQHAQGRTNTGPATAAYNARWAKLVDPDETLDPDERDRRAEHAKSAHYSRMAFESAKSRRRATPSATAVVALVDAAKSAQSNAPASSRAEASTSEVRHAAQSPTD